jgi:transcription initiation factor IIE alpha subunit
MKTENTGDEIMKLTCSRCGAELEEKDAYEIGKEKVCEDCYLDMQMPQHACDPVAQHAADRFFGTFGKRDPEELLEEQRKVYEFIRERGKATEEEILNKFRMRPGEVKQIMIVLRRFKLTKGAKIDDKIYCVPWEYEPEGKV